MATAPSVHASCVLVGAGALLIRGPSGSGKSRLALRLLQAADGDPRSFARLVSDDRTLLEAANGRLLARPAQELAGLIELRGLGIRRVPHEPVAKVALVIDLDADTERLPMPAARAVTIGGVTLPRLAVAREADPLSLVRARLADPDFRP